LVNKIKGFTFAQAYASETIRMKKGKCVLIDRDLSRLIGKGDEA
jgi:hypothetical protein